MSRRSYAGAQRRSGFRGFGNDPPTALGLALTGGADILGGAGSWNSTILGVLVRWVPIALPANSTLSIAMTGDFASAFNLITTTWTSGLVGAVVGFNGAYSTSPTNGVDVHQPGAVGKMHTSFVRLVSGANIQHWFDGEQVGLNGSSAATSLGSASNLAINRRVSADTLPFGSMGFVEIRATTAALTDAQIRAACMAPVGTPLPSGECNAIVAADESGGTIAPRVGGGTYTVSGSPPRARYAIPPKGVGTVEVMGDSIAGGRNASGLLGAGWRREVAQLVNGSRHMTYNGQSQHTDPATVLDFSPSHTCVGGQGLGATPGAGITRLSTVVADRALSIGPAGVTFLGYGTNDIYRRVVELAEAPATCVTNMAADWASEISGLRVARTGPILVATVLRVATGSSTANQRSAIDAWNAALPANVASWNGTYGQVYLCDCCEAATPNQAAADNTAVLYDGTHPTPATYTAMAAPIAARLLVMP